MLGLDRGFRVQRSPSWDVDLADCPAMMVMERLVAHAAAVLQYHPLTVQLTALHLLQWPGLIMPTMLTCRHHNNWLDLSWLSPDAAMRLRLAYPMRFDGHQSLPGWTRGHAHESCDMDHHVAQGAYDLCLEADLERLDADLILSLGFLSVAADAD